MITSINLSLYFPTGTHNTERTDSMEWKDKVDQSHSQGELRLEDNEIVIPRSGLYFVYSQASFDVNCQSGSMVHLSHIVKRWSEAYGNDDTKRQYQTILHSLRTACQGGESNNQERWFSSIYMGAVFNLKAGDRLRTEMEERMLHSLEDSPGKNFFGVFAL